MVFRKRKVTGAVTIFESDDGNAAERFDDLRLDRNTDGFQNLSQTQAEQLALATAQAGKEATARTLGIALEAREIGANTAAKMHEQTTQLERMGEDFEVVHDYLDKSERIIDKMRKPKLVRLFQRKKTGGRGLSQVKVQDVNEREELRRKGIESIDVRAMQSTNVVSLDEMDDESNRIELISGATKSGKRGWKFQMKKPVAVKIDTRNISEDYSEYSGTVAQTLRQQDDDLDLIGDALTDMKAMANAMGNELDYQNELICEVQDFTTETSRRTKENARKIETIK